MFENPE